MYLIVGGFISWAAVEKFFKDTKKQPSNTTIVLATVIISSLWLPIILVKLIIGKKPQK
jgi:divalent metal cation (Fe/Co/Zn/Cd) transporter